MTGVNCKLHLFAASIIISPNMKLQLIIILLLASQISNHCELLTSVQNEHYLSLFVESLTDFLPTFVHQCQSTIIWFVNFTASQIQQLTNPVFDFLAREISSILWGQREDHDIFPDLPACHPDDEFDEVIIPGLHRMRTNYTLDYVVYHEIREPSLYPVTVFQKSKHG